MLSPSGAGVERGLGSVQPCHFEFQSKHLALVQGTLGELGTGRAGTQELVPTCPGAGEHSMVGWRAGNLFWPGTQQWLVPRWGSAQGCWEHLVGKGLSVQH